jgi:hypothetical protein
MTMKASALPTPLIVRLPAPNPALATTFAGA